MAVVGAHEVALGAAAHPLHVLNRLDRQFASLEIRSQLRSSVFRIAARLTAVL
jgi:hypothetical protein